MVAQVTAFVVNSIDEILHQVPLDKAVLRKVFHTQLIERDVNLEMEIQGFIHDRDATFKPDNISIINQFLTEHATQTSTTTHGSMSTQILATNLEQQEFELDMSNLNHDKHAYDIWQVKCEDRHANIYAQKVAYKQQRVKLARDAVASMVEPAHQNFKICLTDLENPAALQATLDDYIKKIIQRNNLDGPDAVVVLVALNWAAPPSISSAAQKAHAKLLGYIVNASDTCNVGLVIMPVYTRQ